MSAVLPLGHAYLRTDQIAALVNKGETSTLVVLVSGYQITVDQSIDAVRQALSVRDPAWFGREAES